MVDPVLLRNVTWGLTAALQLVLLVYIIRQKAYRSHPFLAAYVLSTLVQYVFDVYAIWRWGKESIQYFDMFWVLQALIVFARALAILEITRRVLFRYSAIWRLLTSLLFALGLSVLAVSVALSRNNWYTVVLNTDRAVELCLAVFVLAMFIFARYYRLPITAFDRQIAIGFCLYSCAWVVSNTLFELFSGRDWDYVQVFGFTASMLLWISAVRNREEVREADEWVLLSPEQYKALAGELDSRVELLNHRLDHLLRSEDSRS
jgi:hypothetical protein